MAPDSACRPPLLTEGVHGQAVVPMEGIQAIIFMSLRLANSIPLALSKAAPSAMGSCKKQKICDFPASWTDDEATST